MSEVDQQHEICSREESDSSHVDQESDHAPDSNCEMEGRQNSRVAPAKELEAQIGGNNNNISDSEFFESTFFNRRVLQAMERGPEGSRSPQKINLVSDSEESEEE